MVGNTVLMMSRTRMNWLRTTTANKKRWIESPQRCKRQWRASSTHRLQEYLSSNQQARRLPMTQDHYTTAQEDAMIPADKTSALFTIGILRETYNPWERRAPLCPNHVQELLQRYQGSNNNLSILIQPSSQRIFSDSSYQQSGATVTMDLSSADLILGVKRPKSIQDSLLSNKSYMFFSHVGKGQAENMDLLESLLDQKIQLLDYENIVDSSKRLVAFGKYAGMAGMLDTFYPLGRRLLSSYSVYTPFLQCPPCALFYPTLQHAQQHLDFVSDAIATQGISMPLVFCVTGLGGKVHSGAMDILKLLPHEIISVQDLPQLHEQTKNHDQSHHKIYIVTPGPQDIYYRIGDDNTTFDRNHWRNHPTDYRSTFAKSIAPYIHVLINCVYWDPQHARLLTRDQVHNLALTGQNRLKVISDISCDVQGSIEFLDRTTTIDQPYFQYDPIQRKEVAPTIGDEGITVLGVDILPTELPRESSEHFGTAVSTVLQEIMDSKDQTSQNRFDLTQFSSKLADACVTSVNGSLMPKFRYLNTFLEHHRRRPSISIAGTANHMDLVLKGHLFDSGLINQVLDIMENNQCGFEILECSFVLLDKDDASLPLASRKSKVVLRVSTTNDKTKLTTIQNKIQTLVWAVESAQATMEVLDRMDDGQSKTTSHKKNQLFSFQDKTILLLGAGRVSMSLVDLLGRSEHHKIIVADVMEEDAKKVAALAKNGISAKVDIVNDAHQVSALVEHADLAISLLPAPMHPGIAQECIFHGTHLVTASYESPEIRAMNERAKKAGITIVNEVGLDPGLDHMSAMKIIHDIQDRGGVITSFSSVCGGLPAPEASDNPLRYKFSWSPKGVISACQNSARYRRDNEIVEVDGGDLLGNASPYNESLLEDLECLPNRNSLHYEEIYGLDQASTIFRGTLRYRGFSDLMNIFAKMGLFEHGQAKGSTWEVLLNDLAMQKGFQNNLYAYVLTCANGNTTQADRAMECMRWLGMMEPSSVSNPNSILESFCSILEDHLQFKENERDMVLMHHVIEASFGDKSEIHESSLQVFGDPSMSAMCRTVGYTTAAVAELVVQGGLEGQNGLILPTDKRIYLPTLETVAKEGIVFKESSS